MTLQTLSTFVHCGAREAPTELHNNTQGSGTSAKEQLYHIEPTYRHSAPSYIVVQQLWYTCTSDMASSSTSHPQFLALFSYTLCVASIQPHCSLSRPGYRNSFTLATAPQCEVLHCTVSTQHHSV